MTWPVAMGTEVVFWTARVDKYLSLCGSLEAMLMTLLSGESGFGLKGEHLL